MKRLNADCLVDKDHYVKTYADVDGKRQVNRKRARLEEQMRKHAAAEAEKVKLAQLAQTTLVSSVTSNTATLRTIGVNLPNHDLCRPGRRDDAPKIRHGRCSRASPPRQVQASASERKERKLSKRAAANAATITLKNHSENDAASAIAKLSLIDHSLSEETGMLPAPFSRTKINVNDDWSNAGGGASLLPPQCKAEEDFGSSSRLPESMQSMSQALQLGPASHTTVTNPALSGQVRQRVLPTMNSLVANISSLTLMPESTLSSI
jgi:hypothetical protein